MEAMTDQGSLRGGIDLGGTKVEAIVVDAGQTVLGSSRHPTPSTGGPEAVAAELVAAMRAACQAAGVEPSALQGVGDRLARRGRRVDRDGLDGAEPAELGRQLRARARYSAASWERRSMVGNDVQVATDAEFELGAGRPYRSVLGVMWGTGVGGGLVLDGKPWLGRGGAGEIGHVVVRIDGRRCPCGRKGCMEAYAGRAAMEARARRQHEEKGVPTDLFKLMRDRGRTKLTSAVWAKALDRGDKLTTELIDEAVEALGAGIASAQNLLDVQAIVIGGGLGVRLGEPFVRGSERPWRRTCSTTPTRPTCSWRRSAISAARWGRRCWSAGGSAGPRRRWARRPGRRGASARETVARAAVLQNG